MPTTVKVDLAARSYPVIIGDDAIENLPARLRAYGREARIFVFYDAQLYALHGERINSVLNALPNDVDELILPQGERTKSKASLNRIYDFLLARKVSRTDLVLACGGGVISDLAGFAAATILRGVRWGVVSTTLLGMVDAAIGGKTGINHRTGKNLIGAFWQPAFVICDTVMLETLPRRHLIAGHGETIKYAGLTGQEMHRKVEQYLMKGDLYDRRALTGIIADSVACKADIVARDETESGVRRRLNLGHTFAHAIEVTLGYGRLLHGEAVLVGLAAAVELSLLSKKGKAGPLKAYADLIAEGLKFVPKRKIDAGKVMEAMKLDKKREGSTLNFVLLERPGKPLIRSGFTQDQVRTALMSALKTYDLHGGRHAAHYNR